MLDFNKTEEFLGKVCREIGQTYGGYHTLNPGRLDGVGCMAVHFHVGEKREDHAFAGTGIVYKVLVGKDRCVVFDDEEKEIAQLNDLSQDDLFAPEKRRWWQFWKKAD